MLVVYKLGLSVQSAVVFCQTSNTWCSLRYLTQRKVCPICVCWCAVRRLTVSVLSVGEVCGIMREL